MSELFQKFHYIESEDKLIIEYAQDVEPYLKHCAQQRQILTSKPVDGLGYYAGTIPEAIVIKYMEEAGVSFHEILNNNEHIQRIMNDPEYKKFRVWGGVV